MADLLIRAGVNDHLALANLLAPSPLGRPLSRVVVSAQDVARQPLLAETAAKAGLPLVVDPMTFLAPPEIDPQDPWAELPFGEAASWSAEDLASEFRLERLVHEAVKFQFEQGATVMVPPYFYSDSPASPTFEASLKMIAITARRMRSDAIALPIMPVACLQLAAFSRGEAWRGPIDRLCRAAADVGPQALALYLSPVGKGDEAYSKVIDLITLARYVRSFGIPTFMWRQGFYGPALTALGLDGYETGMAVGEQAVASRYIGDRRPGRRGDSRPTGSYVGIYLPALGRTVRSKAARVLLDDRRLRGRIVCDSPRCCPRGAEDMAASKGRLHAVRARARELDELTSLPDPRWQMLQVEKQAVNAAGVGSKANDLLAAAGIADRVRTQGYESLAGAMETYRKHSPDEARREAQ